MSKKPDKEKVQERIHWHGMFCGAIKLELADYKEDLTFESEYQLSKEALKVDMLIIKKGKTTAVNKNFAQIFKGHNLLEYKSERDYVSVYDYNKVIGYAAFYSAFNKVPGSDITITFVTSSQPKKLFKNLKAKGRKITEAYSGIYYIDGEIFDIQILNIRKLSGEDSLFLKNLRSDLKAADLKDVHDACKRQGEIELKNIFIDGIIQANASVIREVLAMGAAELDAILREAIEKKGWLREFEEKIEQLKMEAEQERLEKERERLEKERERQEKLELERKAEQERQERLELERKAEQEKCKAEQERQEIVRKLLDTRLPLEDIAMATGFSIMDIDKISHSAVAK